MIYCQITINLGHVMIQGTMEANDLAHNIPIALVTIRESEWLSHYGNGEMIYNWIRDSILYT